MNCLLWVFFTVRMCIAYALAIYVQNQFQWTKNFVSKKMQSVDWYYLPGTTSSGTLAILASSSAHTWSSGDILSSPISATSASEKTVLPTLLSSHIPSQESLSGRFQRVMERSLILSTWSLLVQPLHLNCNPPAGPLKLSSSLWLPTKNRLYQTTYNSVNLHRTEHNFTFYFYVILYWTPPHTHTHTNNLSTGFSQIVRKYLIWKPRWPITRWKLTTHGQQECLSLFFIFFKQNPPPD
jgi:hypothetical protein